MSGYEIRVDFSDGFEIQTHEALSINGAMIIARTLNPTATSFTLLAAISSQPQAFLAW